LNLKKTEIASIEDKSARLGFENLTTIATAFAKQGNFSRGFSWPRSTASAFRFIPAGMLNGSQRSSSENEQTIVFNTTVCVRRVKLAASCENAAIGNVGRLRPCPAAAQGREKAVSRKTGGEGGLASDIYRDAGTVVAKSHCERRKGSGKGVECVAFKAHR
jgi:hypothetical protein